jgi:excinuclease ABC subunit A
LTTNPNIHPPKSTEIVEVIGARVHNLKNIDVSIPRDALTVITGLSGSGKSSLAFDTIFAEGQRRYIETFSAYARSFLGTMERPDVDKITGLSPVISIEQKTTNKNPRSTVGTTTEIYDFLRLLFARAGEAYSYITGEKMVKYSEDQIVDLILADFEGKKTFLLAPLVRGRKGHYKELFEQIRKKGYLHVRIDGVIREASHGLKLDRYKNHDIEVVIDKLEVSEKDRKRLKESMQKAMQQGNGIVMLLDKEAGTARYFSKMLMCPTSGISYDEPAPHNFSFNSPHGACPNCKGLGFVNQIDMDKIVPDRKQSIYQGGIAPLGKHKSSTIFWQIEAILEKYDCTLKTPIASIPEEAIDEIMNGTEERLNIKNNSLGTNYFLTYDGILKYIEMQAESGASATEQKWANQYSKAIKCPECNGAKLRKESLFFRMHDKNISELSELDISELSNWSLLRISCLINKK